ncbi:SprB repeat-containing protein, partial [Flavobacterium beibuense]|uniref:SprB repeat-containing protein n=1 Tax=Flavobacterium beibuense TaxID=657326 RepID=UPI0012FC66BC
MKKLLLLLGLMSCVYSFGQCPGDTQAPYSGVASGSTSISQRGRTSTYTNVNLNGTGTNEAFVTSGATVTFSYDYSMVYNTGGACPTCPTQHFVGMNNVFTDCHEEGTGNISTSFTAPTAEGSYYITQSSDWAAGCYAFNSFDPNNSYAAVAVLHVGAPSLIPPANVVVNSTTAACTTVVNGIRIVAIDDCTDPITLTYDITGATTGTGSGDASGTTFNAGVSTVTYTATDSSLNTSTATFTVTVTGTTGTISSQTNVSCNGNTDGAATIDVTGGITPYTYLWSDGQTTATATGLAAGDYTVTVTDAVGCATIVDVTITEPTALAITPSQVNILCNGTATGEATVSVTGGTGAYTYLWSDGQTTATATGLTAGAYSVTVTDANSCTLTENFTITELPALTATPTGVDIVCNGDASGSASVAVTGGAAPYTYLWNTTETTATISNLTAGIYTVDIEDANGCTTNASVTINESPALVVNETHTDVQCNGNDTGVASVIVTGGATPYTYLWNNGEESATITNLLAGTYTVEVKDNNNCTKSLTIEIQEPDALESTPSQVDILCNGDNTGAASLTITGGVGPYSYLWDTGEITDNIANLVAGNYSVIVTDANGCTLTQLYTIDEPAVLSVNPTQTNILCNGNATGSATATVSGGKLPYNYLWSNGETTATISGLTSGNYSVGIIDANGCTISQSFFISQPNALTATTAKSDIACNGDDTGVASITVSGGVAPYTYEWSNGEDTAAITGLTAGIYTVEVTDTNGCKLTRSFDIQQPDPLFATTTQIDVLCNGAATGEATITVTGGIPPYSYLWDNGQATSTATGLTSGAHSVFVNDANGCTLTQSIFIEQPDPLVVTPNTTKSDVLCNGGTSGNATIVVEGGVAPYTYLWSDGQETLTAVGLAANIYTVEVTDANGCILNYEFDIQEPAALTSIPSQNNIVCNGNATGAASVVINGGVQPYTYEWNTGATTDAISGLTAGTYYVTVTDDNGCILIQNFNISEPPALAVGPATAQTDILCNGAATGSATIDVTGGTTPYSYLWSDGQTTATATGLTAGTYDVLVTDFNNCTLSYEFIIDQPDALLLTATQTDVLCNGNNTGEATVIVEGGVTPYSYDWSNGEITSTITGLTAGTYTVDITDANGCSLTHEFIIDEPELLTGTPSQVDVLCNG